MPLALTDHMKEFVNQQAHLGLYFLQKMPQHLKQEVNDFYYLKNNLDRQTFFFGKIPLRQLHSDSSNHAWAGLDIKNGTVVQEFWR